MQVSRQFYQQFVTKMYSLVLHQEYLILFFKYFLEVTELYTECWSFKWDGKHVLELR